MQLTDLGVGGVGEGVARLKLFKQSIFFQRPFPVLFFFSFLIFFTQQNTTALLFSFAEHGEIRCHHLNIKVPRWKSAYEFRPALPIMATCHTLQPPVLFLQSTGLSDGVSFLSFERTLTLTHHSGKKNTFLSTTFN